MSERTTWKHPTDCGCGKCDADKVLTRMYEAEYQVRGLEREVEALKAERDRLIVDHHKNWPDCPRCVSMYNEDEAHALLQSRCYEGFPSASDGIFDALKAAEQRAAEAEKALREAIGEIESSRKGSIGSIGNVYLAQIDVATVERWRAALSVQEGS